MVMPALRLPVAVGMNATEIVQLAPAGRLAGQVLVWAKSPPFVPVTAILLIVRGTLPVLRRPTFCETLLTPRAWIANVRLVGEAEACRKAVLDGLMPA